MKSRSLSSMGQDFKIPPNPFRTLVFPILLALILGCGGGESIVKPPPEETHEDQETAGLSTVSLSDRDIQILPSRGLALGPIRLEPVTTHSRHLLILGNLQETTAQVVLRGGEGAAQASPPKLEILDPPRQSAAETFHQDLRLKEAVFAQSASLALPKKQVAVGCPDSREFRVLATLQSLSLTTTVTAVKINDSSSTCTYLDPDISLDRTKLLPILEDFDSRVVPLLDSLLGSPSDINDDGRVTILLTPAVNRLATSGGGMITGFFFAGDLFPRTASHPASNEQEIIYLAVPDPDGIYGPRLDPSFAYDVILPAVLAHEYQHMVNFSQHMARGATELEAAWLNEAMSHLVEDIVGFGTENFSRVALCLQTIDTTSLVPMGPPTLNERGCGYLFLRYLYDQMKNDPAFLARLIGSDTRGIPNLVAAVGNDDSNFNQFSEIWARWQVAVALSGTGALIDPRFVFKSTAPHPITGRPTGICLRCEAEDGRQTRLKGPSTWAVTAYPTTIVLSPLATKIMILSNPPPILELAGGPAVTLIGSLTPLD